MEKIFVCISCYYKGGDFLEELKRLGNKVILITSDNLKSKDWPWKSIDEVYYMTEVKHGGWNLDYLVQGFSHLMKIHQINAVIALDDYDVEKAAMLRETFRIPGMGQTTHRYFRDKLAMRQRAKDCGINVPEFCSVFNDEKLTNFCDKNPSPWVLKPRSEASASGIQKINSKEQLWNSLEKLEEERYLFLLESFKPGKVFHVDSLVYDKEIIFTSCAQYLSPPMNVAHDGGVFRTKTLGRYSEKYKALERENKKVLQSFGLINGATHTEFILGDDGKWYFLETSSRVGGAHIPDLIEASSGINIWHEWAKIEDSLLRSKKYDLPKPTGFYAGLIVSLAKEKHPNTKEFECEEIYKFLNLDYHIGIVYKSDKEEMIKQRLDEGATQILDHVLNIIPPQTRPTS
ncbi:ATP-grasp domain-containing protein [Halpernia sp.]|uniref:ATP-grasp domain-containing protein n=1 Tax=Halpernia sp. TaxID=2782209 RepID=UPI003A92AAC2